MINMNFQKLFDTEIR